MRAGDRVGQYLSLRAQLPQRSGTVHGLKLPARVAARVQGSQIALGGPGVGGVQERERERGDLNARARPAARHGLWALQPLVQVLGTPGPALYYRKTVVATQWALLKHGGLQPPGSSSRTWPSRQLWTLTSPPAPSLWH